MQSLLDDLRALVSEQGRVVVSVCDPNFTFGGTSPEAQRDPSTGRAIRAQFRLAQDSARNRTRPVRCAPTGVPAPTRVHAGGFRRG